MATFKLKDKNGVETTYTKSGIKIPKADGTGYVVFGGGIPGTYTVSLSVDGTVTSSIAVPQGKSMSNAYSPTKSGYVFVGWATTSSAIIPNITFPYTPTADVTLYAVFNTVIQLKASPIGYGNSSPSSIAFSTNADLRDWVPETITQAGTDFIKIPTMYRKVVATSNNQITSFIISSWKEDSDFHPYSVFVDESGNLLPYGLIGKNWMSTSRTIEAGRTQARAKGRGYQLYDWQFQKLWQDLICAKMQTIDINSGSGITTDALGINWGSTGCWIDGTSYQSSSKKWAICYHPSKYVNEATVSTDGYQEVSYALSGTSGNEIQSLGYDSNHEFFNYPKTTTSNSSYNTYYCDGVWFGTSDPTYPVVSNVGYAYADFGAFRCTASYSWSDSLGVRLCYRPL